MRSFGYRPWHKLVLTFNRSFDSIDPTPCHASAHPLKHESTVAFTINDTSSETPNTITASEITTRHIRRLVSSASDFLGRKVTAAVVSTPTSFTEEQKSALYKSAQEAGLQVLQTISEPTAAVLAYDARPEAKLEDKNIVVADFGGIRSDITVIASRGGMYTILATIHDYEAAGNSLDQVLVDHFAKEFLKKFKDASDPRQDPRALAKLNLEAERTKKALSIGGNAALSIESLISGLDFSSTINRTRYEMLSTKPFGSLTRLITEAIKKADLDPIDIDEVILSGGTSHTPRLASNIAALFPTDVNKRPFPTRILAPSTSATTGALDPSTLAARGAAIQASLISGYEIQDIEQNTHPMCTATPHLSQTIGVMLARSGPGSANAKEVFYPLIERETAVPCRRTGIFSIPASPTSAADGSDPVAPSVLIRFCEATPSIQTTETAPPAKPAKPADGAGSDADSDDDDDDESDASPQITREKIYTPTSVLAELALRNLSLPPAPAKDASEKKKKKAREQRPRIEVTLDVAADMSMSATAREIGGSGKSASTGVRGKIEGGGGGEGGADASGTKANGRAS